MKKFDLKNVVEKVKTTDYKKLAKDFWYGKPHGERRLGDRWRLRAEATDLFGRDFHETRDKYDGPRSTGGLEEIERRERRSPGYVSLTLRRSMGG